MTWFCPTFQRPHRLAALAESWEKHEIKTPLFVRVWDQDPHKDLYFGTEWPDEWVLYESGKQGAGEALNEFFDMYPDEETYGFLGDDVILETEGGLAILEQAAKPFYVSYPNDCFQQFRIPVHFCMGGELARLFQRIVPRQFKHNYMDVAVMELVKNFNMLRYCPEVVIHHHHFFNHLAERDATYQVIYPDGGDVPSGPFEEHGQWAMKNYRETDFNYDLNVLLRAIQPNGTLCSGSR